MTVLEPVELTYEMRELPPGRVGFRRWRWELWHGPRMLAAGWRLSPRHAQRALRLHSLLYAHRINGLHFLRTPAAEVLEPEWRTPTVALSWGEVRVDLAPKPEPAP